MWRRWRAARRIRKPARMCRQRVVVAFHQATIEGVQLLQIGEVVDGLTGDVCPGGTGCAEQHEGVGVAGFDSGIACLQQWHIHRRSDVAVAHLARQVFFIPYLVRLHFAGVPGRERLRERPVFRRIGRRQAAGCASVERRRVHDAEHDVQAVLTGGRHDGVELRPIELTRRRLDCIPAHLLRHPPETGLLDQASSHGLAILAEVVHFDVEAVGKARCCRCTDWHLRDERVGEVRAGQVSGTGKPSGVTRRVLRVIPRALRLLRQIGWEVLAGENGFEIVSQQQTLSTGAGLVVVHNSALETLVDEIVVGRIDGWLTGRYAPDLEIEARQQ